MLMSVPLTLMNVNRSVSTKMAPSDVPVDQATFSLQTIRHASNLVLCNTIMGTVEPLYVATGLGMEFWPFRAKVQVKWPLLISILARGCL